MKDLSIFEKKIGFVFKNKDLLTQSLIHRSYLNEHPNFRLGQNERLEFLGDAVLELIITEFLYHKYPNEQEGTMTNWRASLVNSKMLTLVAKNLKIEDYLFLSKGEEKDKSVKARRLILANSVEALIGAIYLDQGIEQAKKFIEKYFLIHFKDILKNKLYLDPKSRFQEVAQEKLSITPSYKLISESGPDHAKVFKIGAYLANDLIADAEGSSKQEAEEKAAKKAIEKKGWE